jgi:Flp pilus assembly protein TadB
MQPYRSVVGHTPQDTRRAGEERSMEMFLFPAVALVLVAMFSFVAVAAWASQRRKERESLYYNETIRKIAEMHGPQAVLDYMRETDKLKTRRIGNGLVLGGILAVFGGVALMIFLWNWLVGAPYVYLVGLIPVLVGAGLLVYAFAFAPRKSAAP